ncbi:unnamed protein product [Cuscuta europaea]|uniref:Uncharacterized protein n=1 Tax=Cuscuta europaea TaxID=41803 RepID=A0A9P1EKX3_CUSEU|nr:unnamed protein product [Cuscuta europaea]
MSNPEAIVRINKDLHDFHGWQNHSKGNKKRKANIYRWLSPPCDKFSVNISVTQSGMNFKSGVAVRNHNGELVFHLHGEYFGTNPFTAFFETILIAINACRVRSLRIHNFDLDNKHVKKAIQHHCKDHWDHIHTITIIRKILHQD